MADRSEIEAKLDEILKREPRFDRAAYLFVTDAVTFTVDRLQAHRHVSARELLEGLRDYAGQEFGVMAPEVLASWGIRNASEVGEIVYLLIGAGLLSASPEDRREDFDLPFPLTVPAAQQPRSGVPLPKID